MGNDGRSEQPIVALRYTNFEYSNKTTIDGKRIIIAETKVDSTVFTGFFYDERVAYVVQLEIVTKTSVKILFLAIVVVQNDKVVGTVCRTRNYTYRRIC